LQEPVTLSPVAGEPELLDPAVTGQFADAMAAICATVQTPPWCGYIARRASGPVGFGGFKHAPDDEGAVEIGYLTFPAWEGSGVATATAAAMVAIARENGARAVLAHTLAEENASTAVSRLNGFMRAGEAQDPDEGTVWCWRLELGMAAT
jgi:ribosomal-protein-alanine N-acetyltransferase